MRCEPTRQGYAVTRKRIQHLDAPEIFLRDKVFVAAPVRMNQTQKAGKR
jgi:hypothetical protein